MSSKSIIIDALAAVDIQVNGSRPWDIQVHNERFYDAILGGGSIGIGEAYMDGWWDADALDEFFFRIHYNRLDRQVPRDWNTFKYFLKAKYTNRQTRARAKQVIDEHYNLGNDLYSKMLDSRMVYSCAYWENARDLEEAQEAKLDLICRKLKLEPGMRLLDIGCGWGGLAKFAAERYGAQVTAVTLSDQQAIIAREVSKGLPVEVIVQDYRNITGVYDRVTSIAFLEAVGWKNHRLSMEIIERSLTDEGIALIHTIGGNYPAKYTDAWIDKYIFPNGSLPSSGQICTAMKGLFILEDWHNFGTHYDPTLMAWLHNFEKHWPELKDKYGERFRRMWRFYLTASASSFRARRNHLWQIVVTKPKRLAEYKAER